MSYLPLIVFLPLPRNRDSTGLHSVLRYCNLDGSGYTQYYLYRTVDGHVSTDAVLSPPLLLAQSVYLY